MWREYYFENNRSVKQSEIVIHSPKSYDFVLFVEELNCNNVDTLMHELSILIKCNVWCY